MLWPAKAWQTAGRLSRRLAAAPDQVIAGRPVDQAFLTLGVEGQPAIAVQRTGRGRFLRQAIDDVITAQAYIYLIETAIGEAPLHFGLGFSWALFIPMLVIYLVTSLEAIGDVTAKLMLAHTAEAMGIVAAETIADAETVAANARALVDEAGRRFRSLGRGNRRAALDVDRTAKSRGKAAPRWRDAYDAWGGLLRAAGPCTIEQKDS